MGIIQSAAPICTFPFSRRTLPAATFQMIDAIARKFVRNDLSGRASLPSHQFPEEPHCHLSVLTLLNQDIENITILINRTPQVSLLTSSRHDVNLIHVK